MELKNPTVSEIISAANSPASTLSGGLRNRIGAAIKFIELLSHSLEMPSHQLTNLWVLIRILDPSYDTSFSLKVTCSECGKQVEPTRQCYAVPMCMACLAPPDPLREPTESQKQ